MERSTMERSTMEEGDMAERDVAEAVEPSLKMEDVRRASE
jgi:hypothetical protein